MIINNRISGLTFLILLKILQGLKAFILSKKNTGKQFYIPDCRRKKINKEIKFTRIKKETWQ